MAVLTPDKVTSLNGVTLKEYLLTKHNPNNISMPSKRIGACEGITIHNTDVIKVSGTTMSEQYTRATVNGNMGTVRVHYYVDDKETWQNLPDSYMGWHAADGSGAGNSTTIAIECIMGAETGFEKAEDNCARLAAKLLYDNNLTIDKLYTHTYWLNIRDKVTAKDGEDLRTKKHSYKTCPLYIIPHWDKFKATVNKYLSDLQNPKLYYVQVGAFSSKVNAEKYLSEVKKTYPNAFIKNI